MIELKKGEQKEVLLTLKEKTTLNDPVYLFEFISKTTKISNTCIAVDKSISGVARDRANIFDITEGTDDRLNGELILTNPGTYQYVIREQTSLTNLDTALSGAIVERGPMLLVDSESSNYITHDIEITYVIHEP